MFWNRAQAQKEEPKMQLFMNPWSDEEKASLLDVYPWDGPPPREGDAALDAFVGKAERTASAIIDKWFKMTRSQRQDVGRTWQSRKTNPPNREVLPPRSPSPDAPRRGKNWTVEENERILAELADGYGDGKWKVYRLVEELKRPPDAIICHFNKLQNKRNGEVEENGVKASLEAVIAMLQELVEKI